jgi:2-dehydro-3-deoxygluconokinase
VTGGLVTCGETMVCLAAPEAGPLRTAGTLRLSIAGAESNVAIGIARLGHPATWIGHVGEDELGDLVLRTLRGERVDVSAVRRDHAPTGLMLKERRVGTVTRVHYYRAGSAGSCLGPDDIDVALVAAAGLVHVTGITPALGAGPAEAVDTLVTAAHRHGVPVSVDVNHRGQLWPSPEAARTALATLAGRADYVFASEDELPVITGTDGEESVRDLVDGGAQAVVVSRGASGADVWTAAGMTRRAAMPVAAVDTVGAGDALCAGFLSGVLDGLDSEAALQRGLQTAAFAVATAGDWEGLPSRAELELLAGEDGATLR